VGLFSDIKSKAAEQGLDFLVIGGIAVIFHGYARDTADLDILIRRRQRAAWMKIFTDMGYGLERDAEVFIQLNPPRAGAWPVDLMLVEDASFEPMLAAGHDAEMYGSILRIPALNHLIALKLHALKNGHPGRFLKDLLDVENLVRIHSLDLKTDPWRAIFLKYGTPKHYEQISRFSAGQQE
jgi:hypothetical protein